MKHILAMVKPYPDLRGLKASKVELDYLRVVYAVGEMRRQGELAQGYFVVIGESIPKNMTVWEQNYRGNSYVELMSTLPATHVRHGLQNDKTADLSGMVLAALLDDTSHVSNSAALRDMEDYILDETIRELEPGVMRIKDEARFPLGIRWDYYGLVDLSRN